MDNDPNCCEVCPAGTCSDGLWSLDDIDPLNNEWDNMCESK